MNPPASLVIAPAATAPDGAARGGGPRAAYLHLPFCHRRCFYCDFPVVPLGDRADGGSGPGSASIAAYLSLLQREIEAAAAGPPLSTVYLGGGTPSLLTPAQVEDLLAALARRYGLAPGAEITLELDPAGFDRARLAGYLAAGVNRVSLGGQSFDDGVLASLGRRHRGTDLREAAHWLRQAHRAGELRSWSLDLLQGVPAPSAERPPPDRTWWAAQLEEAVALDPPHLSVYDLIVEPGTVFGRRATSGGLSLPDEDLAADLMDLTQARLTAAGYGRYEISNYALPGHASRHNRVYWSGAPWWGFGMGATSAPAGRRVARPRTRAAYEAWLRDSPPSGGGGGERGEEDGGGLPVEDRLLVGLRRREGVPMGALAIEATGENGWVEDLRQHLAPFERRGLLLVEGPRWRLSDPEGLALSNAVLRELLAWWERHRGAGSPGC